MVRIIIVPNGVHGAAIEYSGEVRFFNSFTVRSPHGEIDFSSQYSNNMRSHTAQKHICFVISGARKWWWFAQERTLRDSPEMIAVAVIFCAFELSRCRALYHEFQSVWSCTSF